MKMQISLSEPRVASLSAVISLEALGFSAVKEIGLEADSVIEIDENTAMIVFADDDAAPDRTQSGKLQAALEKGAMQQNDELLSFAIDHEDYLGLGDTVVCYKFAVRRADHVKTSTSAAAPKPTPIKPEVKKDRFTWRRVSEKVLLSKVPETRAKWAKKLVPVVAYLTKAVKSKALKEAEKTEKGITKYFERELKIVGASQKALTKKSPGKNAQRLADLKIGAFKATKPAKAAKDLKTKLTGEKPLAKVKKDAALTKAKKAVDKASVVVPAGQNATDAIALKVGLLDKNPKVRAAALANRNLPIAALFDYKPRGAEETAIRQSVLDAGVKRIESLPNEEIDKLVSGNSQDKILVALSPKTPTRYLERLAKDTTSSIRDIAKRTLADSGGTAPAPKIITGEIKPADLINSAGQSKFNSRFKRGAQIREAVSLSPDEVKFAANSPDADIRYELAKRKEADADTIALLVKDKSPAVRSAAAASPNMDKTTYQTLFRSRDPIDAKTFKIASDAFKKRSTDEVLNSKDPELHHLRVRMAPSLDAKQMSDAVNSEDAGVRHEAAKRKEATPQQLTQLSKDPKWTIRSQVAQNPNTPRMILDRLLGDPENRVRRDAVWNPQVTDAELKKYASSFADMTMYHEAKNRLAGNKKSIPSY